jgi:NAD(P)-dependent dehydrogenase (short-subunit alcohol dehydrogenase family)
MSHFLIAGGSHGIGRGIVEALTARQHQVTVLSRTQGEIAARVKSGEVAYLPYDFSQPDGTLPPLPDAIRGLAYCPGSVPLRSFKGLKRSDFLNDFQLNFLGAVQLLQAALPALKQSAEVEGRPASVVLFSTVAVGTGLPMHASIAASKGALESLGRTLAAELAPHIRVNCIAPALTRTSLTERFFSTPEKQQAMQQRYPLGRTGTIEDVAGCAAFLLDGPSDWVTGQTWGVDGGMSTLQTG